MGYPIHEAASVFPLMTATALASLAEDIRVNGLRDPIVLWHGQIIDGRNRLAACERADIQPAYAERHDLADDEAVMRFVWSENKERRHLEPLQMASAAQDMEALIAGWKAKAKAEREQTARAQGHHGKEGGRGHKKASPTPEAGKASRKAGRHAAESMTQAAASVGVGHRTMETARKAKQEAPALHEAIKAGHVKRATDAHRILELSEVQQAKVLEKIAAEIEPRQAILAVRQEEMRADMARHASRYVASEAIRVLRCDCLDMLHEIANGMISLLLTDPPYSITDNQWDRFESETAYWEFTRSWLSATRPKMTASFSAFVFCDAALTVGMHDALVATGWPVLRQVIWHRPNLAKKRSGSLTFLSSYEPFWHCGNEALRFPPEWGEERFDVQTFTAPQSNHVEDPARHPTQKPLALFRRLISLGSPPGGLVVDPFCGAGTTAVASIHELRRCITSDISEEYVQIAKGRLATTARDCK